MGKSLGFVFLTLNTLYFLSTQVNLFVKTEYTSDATFLEKAGKA